MAGPTANDLYLLDAFERAGAGTGLDYGCGDGTMVAEGARRGHDFWGAENYYAGRHDQYEGSALDRTPEGARGRIKLLDADSRIPWPDETFDYTCSSQVFEHVEDLDLTVRELARVTKLGGTGVHNFPTLEMFREPHLGVPFFHRLPRAVPRRAWARPWWGLRVANRVNPSHDDFDEWDRTMVGFYDESVFLRPLRTIEAALRERFDVTHAEMEKLSFHTGRSIPENRVLSALEHRRGGVTLRLRRVA